MARVDALMRATSAKCAVGGAVLDQAVAELPALGVQHVHRRPVGEVGDAARAEGEGVVHLPGDLGRGRIAVRSVRHGLHDEHEGHAILLGGVANQSEVVEEGRPIEIVLERIVIEAEQRRAHERHELRRCAGG